MTHVQEEVNRDNNIINKKKIGGKDDKNGLIYQMWR
jgi:hypothetical protein